MEDILGYVYWLCIVRVYLWFLYGNVKFFYLWKLFGIIFMEFFYWLNLLGFYMIVICFCFVG